MKVARACEPASARLSIQAMRLSYFKNSDFTPSLQRFHPLIAEKHNVASQ